MGVRWNIWRGVRGVGMGRGWLLCMLGWRMLGRELGRGIGWLISLVGIVRFVLMVLLGCIVMCNFYDLRTCVK